MINNIYKSWITTVIGILFAFTGIFYSFYKDEPDKYILLIFIISALAFIFMKDDLARKIIDKVTKDKL